MASTVQAAAPRRHPRKPPAWAAYAAPKAGLKPESLEALVKGRCVIAHRFAALVEAAVILGDRRLLDKLMAPVDAALARLPDEVLTPTLQCEAQEADLAEDVAEARFIADPTPDHRRQFAAAVRHERAALLRLQVALEAE